MYIKSKLTSWIGMAGTNYTRKYEIDIYALNAIHSLTKKQFELYKAMLERVGRGCSPDDLIVVGGHVDFGYKTRQHFYKDRKVLIAKDLLYIEGDENLLNPAMLKYAGRKQWDWLQRYCGLNSQEWVPKGFKK
jgi:hypothetical protein